MALSTAVTAAGPRIARYAGDRAAAASFTFDDGAKSHARIAQTLDAYGIKATFFVVAGWVPQVPEEGGKAKLSWPELRDMARAGHEIGNHSLTHMNLQSVTNEETLANEIDASADKIASGVGTVPLSFAYPFCKSNPTVRGRVLSRHVAARGYHPLYEGACPAGKARAWIDQALADGGWHVYLSHGIECDALKAHLEDITPLRDRLWVAPYGQVAAYREARDKASLTVLSQETNRCTFRLTLPAGSSEILSQTPLTVVIPAAGVTTATPVSCQGTGLTVVPEARQGAICVTVKPGPGEVTVTWPAPVVPTAPREPGI